MTGANIGNDAYSDGGSSGGGTVDSVVAGTNVTVDSTDPANPIVSASTGTGIVESVVAGTNVTVDNSDPANPIVSASGGSSGITTITGTHGVAVRSVSTTEKALANIGTLETIPSGGSLAASAATTELLFLGSATATCTLDLIRGLQNTFGLTNSIGVRISNLGTASVTISDSGATINGASSFTLPSACFACLQMDSATTWRVVYNNSTPSAISSPYAYELFGEALIEVQGAIFETGLLTGTTSKATRGFRFVSPGTFIAAKIRMLFRQVTGSLNCRYAIYSSSGNLLASTALFTPSVGINEVALTTSITLSGGSEYYVAYYTSDTTGNNQYSLASGKSTSTADPLMQRHDGNEVPSTIGSGLTNTAYRPWMAIVGA